MAATAPTSSRPTQRGTRSTPNWKLELTDMVDDFHRLTLKYQEVRPSSTGLVYDERMAEHYCLWDSNYPECPERITCPYERCVQYGLIERCQRIECRPSDAKEALRVHSASHVGLWQSTEQMDVEHMMELAKKYDAIFINKATYSTALLSLGSTIDVVRAVVENKVKNSMAIVRPPGHHAMENEANGYCYFNNVAIAARHAIDECGLKRVLIVDWDVHHGQATQQTFYSDPRVLYISIHRYENGWFWPNLEESNYNYIGEGKGKGFNINVPLNQTGMKNGDYLAVFQQLIMPIAHEYNPELVLVSAGYDAAIGCFEGRMEITPAGYAHFTHMLMALAGGKVVVVLEGGYCLESLSEGVALTLRSLLGDPCPAFSEPLEPPSESIRETILNCIYVLRPFWKSLRYQQTVETGGRVEVVTPDPRGQAKFMTSANRPTQYPIKDCYPLYPTELNVLYSQKIAQLIAGTSLTVPPNRTALVYDQRMKSHKNTFSRDHPERPERIQSIHERLNEYGLLLRCTAVKAREATVDELALSHSRKYIDEIRQYASCRPRDLVDLENKYNSIYLNPDSWSCAILSAGALLSVVDSVLLGETVNGAAIIRPPGHHAEVDTACGFCFFNNVAIAAKYAQKKYGLKRVLIVDWDIHHGNGIQHMFEGDKSVLYISLHRYDHGQFFPTSEDGNYDKVGIQQGTGYNVNIPWNKSRMGDPEYIAAFQQIVMPIAYEFAPELVLVSAGFDAAKGDMLGCYKLTPAGYAHMTHMLCGLAHGRVILALEGGYNLSAISEAFATCVHVLLGGTCPQLLSAVPKDSAVETICNVLDVHQQYWRSLRYRVNFAAARRASYESIAKKQKADDSKEDDSKVAITPPSAQVPTDDVIALSGLLQSAGLDDPSSTSGSDTKRVGCITAAPASAGAAAAATTCGEPFVQPQHGNEEPEAAREPTAGGKSHKQDDVQHEHQQHTSRAHKAAVEELLGACGGQVPLEMFAVTPLTWCEHLNSSVRPVPVYGLNTSQACEECGSTLENWVCLQCYKVLCSRFINGHMVQHCNDGSEGHNIVLSFSDFSVWCYACEAYVNNTILEPAKESAYQCKFGRN